ncbi:MAG TPA: lactonase family protein [Edaphobacter sp.]|nr:lactonase family protein [Edaphobacter sp.]
MRKISRRNFIRRSAAATLAAQPLFASAKGMDMKKLLLVGTQTTGTSKGIYSYAFDSTTGELTQTGLAAEAENPTFLALAPNGKTLIAANELDHIGAVTSFTLDRATSKLTKVNQESAKGGGTCHVSVDHTGRAAFAANYGGGSSVSFQLSTTGQLSPAVSFFQYTGKGPRPQQNSAHAHRVTVSPDNRFLLVNDLGLDMIHIYRLDAATAKLTPHTPSEWKSAPGAGPRALIFHPNGKLAYCVNELDSTVSVLSWNAAQGTLETLQTASYLPEGHTGPSGPSDIVIDKKARFAYVANRLDDFMVSFTISPTDGKLTMIERTSSGGTVPRHIALDPTEGWLLVANQTSDNIAVIARDKKTGRLANTSKSFPLSRPQCLVFA